MNKERFEKWMEVYAKHLLEIVSDPKNGYLYGPEAVPAVVAKMRRAFEGRSYNKDGKAIQRTCRDLGIPYSYKAIDAYFRGG